MLKPSDESNEPYKQEEGVSVDEYGCLEVESELHTSNLVASLSQGYTETSIYTTGERAIAVTDGAGGGATVYSLSFSSPMIPAFLRTRFVDWNDRWRTISSIVSSVTMSS